MVIPLLANQNLTSMIVFVECGMNHLHCSSCYTYQLSALLAVFIYTSGFQPGLRQQRLGAPPEVVQTLQSTVYFNSSVKICKQGFLERPEYILGVPLHQKGWKLLIYTMHGQPFSSYGPFAFNQRPQTINSRHVIEHCAHAHAFLQDIGK